jgi:glycosyltransferase involved in cell wall biosynthesis
MPFILKEPYRKSKGIVIFTHKDRRYLETGSQPLADALINLRKTYVIGMHWGSYHDEVDEIPYVDFHLAGQGTLRFKQGVKARLIPLCSRNFTPACYTPNDTAKRWDILMVSRPLRLKNLDQFFQVIRKAYDRGHYLRVLLICPRPERMTPDGYWYHEIWQEYMSTFSEEERGYFTFLLLTGNYPFPLSQETMVYFFNASKIFTLFSNREGESRVIAEALLCGLPVVVKKDLIGGGRDYLTPYNSRQFTTLDEACEIFIDLTENYSEKCVDVSDLQRELSESFTRQSLQAAIESIFAELDLELEGNMDLDQLSRKLPAHHLSLPSRLRSSATNDLKSLGSALIYLKLLAGAKPSQLEMIKLHLAVGREVLRANYRRARSRVRRGTADLRALSTRNNSPYRHKSEP